MIFPYASDKGHYQEINPSKKLLVTVHGNSIFLALAGGFKVLNSYSMPNHKNSSKPFKIVFYITNYIRWLGSVYHL